MAVGTRPYVSTLDGLITLVFIRLAVESGERTPVRMNACRQTIYLFHRNLSKDFSQNFPVLNSSDIFKALKRVQARGAYDVVDDHIVVNYNSGYRHILEREMLLAYGTDLKKRRSFGLLVDRFRELVETPIALKEPLYEGEYVHR